LAFIFAYVFAKELKALPFFDLNFIYFNTGLRWSLSGLLRHGAVAPN